MFNPFAEVAEDHSTDSDLVGKAVGGDRTLQPREVDPATPGVGLQHRRFGWSTARKTPKKSRRKC